ncbi:MAG: adenosylmethionine decarboxylase [Gammaproteobacteria bacterium]|nr:MAG: adenosylmethionine decarboxylase [Gammaproteobacteria bacterium]
MHSLGTQIVAELYACDRDHLNDVAFVKQAMLAAAREAGATIVADTFHHFSPHGVSGAVIIAESHLSIHTWPEYGYAAVDLFTCGHTVDGEKAFLSLKQALGAEQVSTMELHRGLVEMMGVDPETVVHKPGDAP